MDRSKPTYTDWHRDVTHMADSTETQNDPHSSSHMTVFIQNTSMSARIHMYTSVHNPHVHKCRHTDLHVHLPSPKSPDLQNTLRLPELCPHTFRGEHIFNYRLWPIPAQNTQASVDTGIPSCHATHRCTHVNKDSTCAHWEGPLSGARTGPAQEAARRWPACTDASVVQTECCGSNGAVC